MTNSLRVAEIFKSVQGEGRFQGTPALFLRLSGCSRKCSFCDSKYHSDGKNIPFNQIYGMMYKRIASTIVITGGEPLVQWANLKKFLSTYLVSAKIKIHLETNGDLITDIKRFKELLGYFNYIVISPKEKEVAKRVYNIIKEYKNKECYGSSTFADIKVVTDMGKVGSDMLNFATMAMPLTTYDAKKDNKIKQTVWGYCSENNLFYSARLHIDVWGKRKRK